MQSPAACALHITNPTQHQHPPSTDPCSCPPPNPNLNLPHASASTSIGLSCQLTTTSISEHKCKTSSISSGECHSLRLILPQVCLRLLSLHGRGSGQRELHSTEAACWHRQPILFPEVTAMCCAPFLAPMCITRGIMFCFQVQHQPTNPLQQPTCTSFEAIGRCVSLWPVSLDCTQCTQHSSE